MQINDGNYSPTYTEITPVQMSENTEVKVPVVSWYPTNGQSYPTNGQQFSIKTEDSFSECPTESYVEYDNNDVQFHHRNYVNYAASSVFFGQNYIFVLKI